MRALWAALRAGAADALEIPVVAWTLVAVAAALLAFLAARAMTRLEGRGRPGARASRAARVAGDAWADAEAAAAAGRLTEAAHLTYRAVLEALARRDLLRPHPSRTVGDYRRELRARGAAVHADFRAFAGRYEPFVYGGAGVDRAGLDALRAAARPLIFGEGARR